MGQEVPSHGPEDVFDALAFRRFRNFKVVAFLEHEKDE